MIGSKWIAILAAGLALAGCGGGGKGGNAQSAGGGTGSAGRTGGSGGSVQSPGGAAKSGVQKSDQTKIEAAIRSYTSAIADKRAAAACGLLNSTGQRFLSETDSSYRASSAGVRTCERAAAKAAALPVGKGTVKDLKNPTVANIRIVQGTATAIVLSTTPPIQDSVELVKEGNRWKISRPPGIR